jgi:RimJ/RimL family protein N-acetyltransferase
MIRRATVDDARGIAEVHTTTWQAAYRHAFPPALLDALDVDERERRWRDEFLPMPEMHAFAAERDGRIVGWVTVGPSRDADCDGELYGIYVLPEEWGSGIAGELMAAALADLRRSFHEAILWVLGDNPRARGFYEKHGWGLDGAEKRGVHIGVEVDEVRYRTALRDA